MSSHPAEAAACVVRTRGVWDRWADAVVRTARGVTGWDDVRVAEAGTDMPWNVNIHYDARLAHCVPAAATSVLDVGCGDGFLAARLARRVPRVVAIDIDGPVLGRARARFPDAPVTWCQGDILTHPLEAGSFDAVLSNAMLHHLPDTRAALRRLSELVRPRHGRRQTLSGSFATPSAKSFLMPTSGGCCWGATCSPGPGPVCPSRAGGQGGRRDARRRRAGSGRRR